MEYNPDHAPDPRTWLDLEEQERIEAVIHYHRREKIDLPNAVAHATFHVVVESQAAMGDELPVRATLERLIEEGLNRHDAIHAIASVLASSMFDIMKGKPSQGDPNRAYFRELEQLTAEAWLAGLPEGA